MSIPASTIEIRLSVRRQGVWRDIVKVVEGARVLDEARKLSKRAGARELRVGEYVVGPAERAAALPRWVWHVEGFNPLDHAGSPVLRALYWGL